MFEKLIEKDEWESASIDEKVIVLKRLVRFLHENEEYLTKSSIDDEKNKNKLNGDGEVDEDLIQVLKEEDFED